MRRWWPLVVILATFAAARAEAQVNPCRLLGKAEVRAALGSAVTGVSPDMNDDGLIDKCEFSVERGGVTVMVQDRQALEGSGLAAAWDSAAGPKLSFRTVPGLGEEAILGSLAVAAPGQPGIPASTQLFVARQGSQVVTLLVMTLGKGPSSETVIKLGRRAMLRAGHTE